MDITCFSADGLVDQLIHQLNNPISGNLVYIGHRRASRTF
jgi:hypothetical protein